MREGGEEGEERWWGGGEIGKWREREKEIDRQCVSDDKDELKREHD